MPENEKRPRMERMQKENVPLGLPELNEGEYLHELLFELWPTRTTEVGERPTDWDVIAPFGYVHGLDEGDMAALAAMCRGYHQAKAEGTARAAIPPVEQTGDPVADRAKAMSGGIKAAMRGG